MKQITGDASLTNLGKRHKILKSAWLDSPLGKMLTISDEEGIYLLEFSEARSLEKKIERLRIKLKSIIIPGRTDAIDLIEKELAEYFSRNLTEFKTPIHMVGSHFQKMVWQELVHTPYGKTRSYMTQAQAISNPKGYRAVANANGANQLAIIIPCHRIINSNGDLGGYGGGIQRKKWLIEHEKKLIFNRY